MLRAWYAGCLVGCWILVAAGCRMCAHPYDYCGPVVDDPQACCPNARAGSILATGGGYGADAGTLTPTEAATKGKQPTKAPTRALSPPKPVAPTRAPRRAPTPAPAPAPANTAPANQSASKFFPGIPRENILSITDRRLDEVQKPTDTPVAQEEAAPSTTESTGKMQLVRTSPTASPSTAKTSSPVKQTGWTAVRSNALTVE